MQSGSRFQLQLFSVAILSNGRGGRLGISVTNFHANGIACCLTLNNRSRWYRKHKSLISTPTLPSNSVKAKSRVTHFTIPMVPKTQESHIYTHSAIEFGESEIVCNSLHHFNTVDGISMYTGKQNLLILDPSHLSTHISCSQVFSLIKIIQ